MLFSLLAALVPQHPWLSIGVLWERRAADLQRVDPRRLVQFALARGLVRRVHKYLIRDAALEIGAESDLAVEVPADMLTGEHCTDEICCHTGMSARALDELVDGDPLAYAFWK